MKLLGNPVKPSEIPLNSSCNVPALMESTEGTQWDLKEPNKLWQNSVKPG